MGAMRVWRFDFSMADFGGPTLKPTWLYASDERLGDVRQHYVPRNPQPKSMVRRYVDKRGRPVFAGSTDLKASQAYPEAFGRALASTHVVNAGYFRRRARDLHKSAVRAFEHHPQLAMEDTNSDPWHDAELSCILEMLARERA
jgi:hypothetical protein